MKIFVRNEYIKYAVVDKSEFEPYSFLLESYDKIEVKSIEQHDAEVRKHVIAELEEWASYKVRDYDTSLPRLEMINGFIKKLNEMKGE